MENNKVIIIIIFLVAILFFIFKTKKIEMFCEDTSPESDIGQTAKDACNKISSRVEEIKAMYKGQKELTEAALSFLSPANYKSGDNTTNNLVRNIINTNLSQCDVTDIENECGNLVVTSQSNNISNNDCPICDKVKCVYSNIKQTNTANAQQSCKMQSTISKLMKKTNNIDAQALAKALQDSRNQMSGANTSTTENCNVIKTDMSSKEYLKQRSSCANVLAIDQKNNISACGDFFHIEQDNQYKGVQDCLNEMYLNTDSKLESETKIKNKSDTDQTSNTIMNTVGGIVSSVASCSVILCILGTVVYFKSSSK